MIYLRHLPVGNSFPQVTRTCVAMANVTQEAVAFVFNAVEVTCMPGDNPDAIIQAYMGNHVNKRVEGIKPLEINRG